MARRSTSTVAALLLILIALMFIAQCARQAKAGEWRRGDVAPVQIVCWGSGAITQIQAQQTQLERDVLASVMARLGRCWIVAPYGLVTLEEPIAEYPETAELAPTHTWRVSLPRESGEAWTWVTPGLGPHEETPEL